jgi:Leucine-rich repeat (LRR) protein
MNPISSITLEQLPNEILAPILEACVNPSLSSVCTRWRHLLVTEIMPSLYKQIGKMHAPHTDVNKQAFILDRIYKLEEKLSETEKVYAIFSQIFTQVTSLSPLEFKWKTEEKRYFTLTNYCSYLVDINRLLMWKELGGGGEYLEREEIKALSLEEKGKLFKEWVENYSKDITELHLEKIGLTLLPAEIGQLSNLEVLSLKNNELTTLPAEIGQLVQLKSLFLENNPLTSLPAEIGQLSQLQWLFLADSQLTTLPAEIGQLSQLQFFFLHNNRLITLPAEIGQLLQLQGLSLENNQLTTLPAEIGQLSQLQRLGLSNNELTTLPAEIGQLSQLQNLDLSNNNLATVPAEIGQLRQLQELYLKNNPLTTLPAEIEHLLNELNLELNKSRWGNFSKEILPYI